MRRQPIVAALSLAPRRHAARVSPRTAALHLPASRADIPLAPAIPRRYNPHSVSTPAAQFNRFYPQSGNPRSNSSLLSPAGLRIKAYALEPTPGKPSQLKAGAGGPARLSAGSLVKRQGHSHRLCRTRKRTTALRSCTPALYTIIDLSVPDLHADVTRRSLPRDIGPAQRRVTCDRKTPRNVRVATVFMNIAH